jgi:hypothetical protein
MNSPHKAAAAILAALVIMVATAFVVSPRTARGADQGIDRLPGAWHAEITPSGQGGFPALFTFTNDGALIGSESPGPFESPAHGNWVRRGRDVSYTFFVLFGGPQGLGQNTGSAKVVGTLHFDAQGGGWSGPFRVQVFTPAGVAVFSNTGTLELTRIEIESL